MAIALDLTNILAGIMLAYKVEDGTGHDSVGNSSVTTIDLLPFAIPSKFYLIPINKHDLIALVEAFIVLLGIRNLYTAEILGQELLCVAWQLVRTDRQIVVCTGCQREKH